MRLGFVMAVWNEFDNIIFKKSLVALFVNKFILKSPAQ